MLVAILLTHYVCKACLYIQGSRRVNRLSGARQAPRKRSMSERRYGFDGEERSHPMSPRIFEEIYFTLNASPKKRLDV